MNWILRICITFFITFFLTVFFSRCSKDEKKVIPEQKFVEILSDVMIIDNLGIPQIEKVALLKTVLHKHEITTEEFSFTRDRYKENADFWISVYKRTQEKIKEKKSF
jgi:hypothetical protein